jgi:hypothetical protein
LHASAYRKGNKNKLRLKRNRELFGGSDSQPPLPRLPVEEPEADVPPLPAEPEQVRPPLPVDPQPVLEPLPDEATLQEEQAKKEALAEHRRKLTRDLLAMCGEGDDNDDNDDDDDGKMHGTCSVIFRQV